MGVTVTIDFIVRQPRTDDLVACLARKANARGFAITDHPAGVEAYFASSDDSAACRREVRKLLDRCGDDWGVYLSA